MTAHLLPTRGEIHQSRDGLSINWSCCVYFHREGKIVASINCCKSTAKPGLKYKFVIEWSHRNINVMAKPCESKQSVCFQSNVNELDQFRIIQRVFFKIWDSRIFRFRTQLTNGSSQRKLSCQMSFFTILAVIIRKWAYLHFQSMISYYKSQ